MKPAALLKGARGAVYVEFLLVFMPVFLLFLAVVELGQVYAARLVVQHAATRAARAAVVILDDDPARYGGERRGEVDLGGSADTPSPMAAFMTASGLGSAGAEAGGGDRFRDIRTAASIPLLAVSPTAAALEGESSIATAIGRGSERAAEGSRRYHQRALAVTFPVEPRASSFRTAFGKEDQVTVRVTYLFHCGVPLVARLMCDGPSGVGGKLSSAEQAQIDLDFLETRFAGARFLVLRGEATLRNQGAAYAYGGETP
jgi:TadE-like protein